MNISSDMTSSALWNNTAVAASAGSEAGESKAVPDHDGDSDDATSVAPLNSYQGNKIDVSA